MIDGCQAEYVRVPHANLGMFSIPEGLTEEDVLLWVTSCLPAISTEQANIHLVTRCGYGSGPVGMCAMTTARLWGPLR